MNKQIFKALALLPVSLVLLSLTSSTQAKLQKLSIGGSIFIGGVHEENILDYQDSGRDENGYIHSDIDLVFDGTFTDNVSFTAIIENNAVPVGKTGRDSGSFAVQDGTEDALEIPEAYITLSEFIYAPLTLTLGFQYIGYDLRGDGNQFSLSTNVAGVKASLNYDPILIDLFMATATEADGPATANNSNNDSSYYGFHIDYTLDNGIFMFDVVNWQDKSAGFPTSAFDLWQTTFGVDYNVNERWEIYSEVGYQTGRRKFAALTLDQKAWAGAFGAKHNWATTYKPYIDLGYRFHTGTSARDVGAAGKTQEDWVQLGFYEGADADRLAGALITEDSLRYGNNIAVTNAGFTSYRVIAGFSPSDVINVDLGIFKFDRPQKRAGTFSTKLVDDLGWEIDAVISYAYTEDLTLRAGLGWVLADDIQASNTTTGKADDATLLFWDAFLSF